jgi:sugar-specific transcriptional regulator TrmB
MVIQDINSLLSDIEDKLRDYGLSERQIKVYLLLVINGPMKLSELAYKAGLYRMQVYTTLKQLIQLGIVEATLGRPITYLAVPPKKALNLLLEDISARLERAKENQAFILEKLTSLTKLIPSSSNPPKFKIIQGRKQYIKVAKQSYKRARFEINNINTPNSIVRGTMVGFDELAEECVKRGVKIRWITDVTPQNVNEIRRLCEFGEVRHLQINSAIRLVIVDKSETLISSIYDDSFNIKTEGEVTLCINDPNISTFINHYFIHLWNDAKPVTTESLKNYLDASVLRG